MWKVSVNVVRYYLIDKVVYLEHNRRLTALKNVALSEDVYADHFYGNPIMPGALQIESLAQAGTVLLEVSSRFTVKAVLIMVEKVKFRELVRPGDQLSVAVEVVTLETDVARLDGTIHVGERLVASGRLMFSLQPIDEYYPPRVRHLTTMFYDSVLRDAELVGVDYPEKDQ